MRYILFLLTVLIHPTLSQVAIGIVDNTVLGVPTGEVTFTVSGSWNKPSGVTSVTVECWSGGGAGGSGANVGGTNYGGGGGKGCQYARSVLTYSASSSTINFTIATTSTGNGGDTNWDSGQVIARGGSMGANAGAGSHGAGATTHTGSGVGEVIYNGGNGGSSGFSSGGGGGGAGSNGVGGQATLNTGGIGNTDFGGYGGNGGGSGNGGGGSFTGLPGEIYGGGGSGGRRGGNGGGTGFRGLIRITY